MNLHNTCMKKGQIRKEVERVREREIARTVRAEMGLVCDHLWTHYTSGTPDRTFRTSVCQTCGATKEFVGRVTYETEVPDAPTEVD